MGLASRLGCGGRTADQRDVILTEVQTLMKMSSPIVVPITGADGPGVAELTFHLPENLTGAAPPEIYA